MILLLVMAVPIVFAGVLALGRAEHARKIALVGSLVQFALALYAAWFFPWDHAGAFAFPWQADWLAPMGLRVAVGADSVSIMLILLTALLGPICVAASFTAITERVRTYYAWLLILQGAMAGVFAARDLVLFYVCFEFTLIPMFVLISLYGSTNRKKAAIKFFLYTFTGSVIALAGLVYVAWSHADRTGRWTFDIDMLATSAKLLPASAQGWVMLALILGFAVKVPLFPFHTWLPLAHTEAPTAGSVVLAGVLLKLGTYGFLRFVLPFAPAAVAEHAPTLAFLCVVGIVYGGLICWVQTDVKKLVAYSSVAHLGFCMLGMFALNRAGLQGSILYMINHGLSTGALFLLIGMIYERYHTRDMKQLGGLAARMPVWATFMVFFTMSSVGLPGLNGFVSEFLCLLGAFQASSAWGSGLWGTLGTATPGATGGHLGPWYAAIAGTGMIVAAMYLLYMVGKVVWGPLVEPAGHAHGEAHHAPGHGHHGGHEPKGVHPTGLPADLTKREIAVLIPLAVLCLALGIYPKPATDALEAPVAGVVRLMESAPRLAGAPPIPTQVEAKAKGGER